MTARKRGKEQGRAEGKEQGQVKGRGAGQQKDSGPIGRMPEPGTPLGSPDEDARWTAWALGDEDALDDADREAMVEALKAEGELPRELEGLREVATAVKQAYGEERREDRATSGEDALDPAARQAVLDAGARRRKSVADPSPRRRSLRLPGFGNAWQAAASLAVAFFLVIPALRWGFDRTPPGASLRVWYAAVTDPSMMDLMDQGEMNRDVLPEPPPPRSFRELVPWPSRRDVSGTAGSLGSDGRMEGAQEEVMEGSSDERAAVLQPTAAPRALRGQGAVDADLADPSRKIVLNGRVRAEVEDVMRTADEISAWVVRRGGFVESSRMDQSADGGGATMVLRIPRLEFDALRQAVRERAVTVLIDESDRVDRSASYADTRERLKSLRSTEAELRELLEAQRETGRETKDVLEIFDLLKEYRTQIEGLEGQLGTLEEQATLSTLTLELITHRPPVPTATPTATPEPISRLDRIGTTVQSARVDLFDGLELVLRAVLYLTIAILPPLLLLIAFIWLWWQGTQRAALWWSRTHPS